MTRTLAVPLPSLLLLLLLLLLLVLVPAVHGECGHFNITISGPQSFNSDGGQPTLNKGGKWSCLWVFKSADPNDRLRISDIQLTKERTSNFSCLALFDGAVSSSSVLALPCAKDGSTQDFASGGDILQVFFYYSPQGRIQFTVQNFSDESKPGWNREVQLGTTGEIFVESPNYPSPYPRGFRCWWRLRAPPGFRVHLKSLTFDMESSSWLRADILTVYDGWDSSVSVKRHFEGRRGFQTLRSSGQYLYLAFKTDTSVNTHTGFRLSSLALPDENFTGVNREIFVPNSTYQFLTTPNFPENYPSNFRCWWLLRAPPGVILELSSVTFDVPCTSRGSDRLVIYDGNSTSALRLESACGRGSRIRSKSTGNFLYLDFKSDFDDEVGGGFHLKFHALTDVYECNSYEKINMGDYDVMYFTSPRYPLSYDDDTSSSCSLAFLASRDDHVIKVEAVEFEMPGTGDNCQFEKLEVYSGDYHTSRQLATWCGTRPPTVLYSKESSVFFSFSRGYSTPSGQQARKFKIRLQQVPSSSTPAPTTIGRAFPVGTILGAFFGVLAVLLVAGGVLCCLCCCSRARAKPWSSASVVTSTPASSATRGRFADNNEEATYPFRTAGARYQVRDPVRRRPVEDLHTPVNGGGGRRREEESEEEGYLPPAYPDDGYLPWPDADPSGGASAPTAPPMPPSRGDNSDVLGPEAPPPSYDVANPDESSVPWPDADPSRAASAPTAPPMPLSRGGNSAERASEAPPPSYGDVVANLEMYSPGSYV